MAHTSNTFSPCSSYIFLCLFLNFAIIDYTDEENSNNNATSSRSNAAEKQLVETLQKQRQQQLAEERRLLQEQKKEKERLEREKEKQREKERLEKERERLQEVEKDPKKHGLMNSHKQPHENYYESTMNAAGITCKKYSYTMKYHIISNKGFIF